MLRCQHEGSQLKLVEGIGKLRDWMGKMKTPQQLADQIVAKIKKELQMPHTSFLGIASPSDTRATKNWKLVPFHGRSH